jgi:hypothetical protein
MRYRIKDFYWEGNSFVIETQCGKRHVFAGAYVSDVKYSYPEDSGIQVDRFRMSKDGHIQKEDH